jgi:hypothetical protein
MQFILYADGQIETSVNCSISMIKQSTNTQGMSYVLSFTYYNL